MEWSCVQDVVLEGWWGYLYVEDALCARQFFMAWHEQPCRQQHGASCCFGAVGYGTVA